MGYQLNVLAGKLLYVVLLVMAGLRVEGSVALKGDRKKRVRDDVAQGLLSPLSGLEHVHSVLQQLDNGSQGALLSGRTDHVFVDLILSQQEKRVVELFCDQINISPSYWPSVVNNLKREMKWPSDRPINSRYDCWRIPSDEGSSQETSCWIKQFLASKGCGSVHIEHELSDGDKAPKDIYLHGLVVCVRSNFFQLHHAEQLECLEPIVNRLRSGAAFYIHIMQNYIHDSDALVQPRLMAMQDSFMQIVQQRLNVVKTIAGEKKKCGDREFGAVDDESKLLTQQQQEHLALWQKELDLFVCAWIAGSQHPEQEDVQLAVEIVDNAKEDNKFAVIIPLDDGIGRVFWADMDRPF